MEKGKGPFERDTIKNLLINSGAEKTGIHDAELAQDILSDSRIVLNAEGIPIKAEKVAFFPKEKGSHQEYRLPH